MRRSCGGVWIVPCPTPSAAQQRPRYDPRPVCVGFVVEKAALGQVLLLVLRVFPSGSFHQCSLLSNDLPTLCNFSTSECGNEPSVSIKYEEFLEYMRTGQLNQKDSAPWRK